MLDDHLREAFLAVVIFSGIPLVTSSICGLLVAILQAATQIQEQSISFVVRASCVGIVLLLLSDWYREELISLIRAMLLSIGAV